MSKPKEKSAEVIVVAEMSLCPKGTTQEVSQNGEGPNIKLFQMLHGVKDSHALSGTGKQRK